MENQNSQNTIEIETVKKRNYKKILLILVLLISILGGAGFFFYSSYANQETLTACVEKDSDIYERYKNATVLLKHEFGYQVVINGETFFINFPDAPTETTYGTGFFLYNNTSIYTNRHVAQPWTDPSTVESYATKMNNVKMKIASILTEDVDPSDYQSFIESNWQKGKIFFEGDGDGGEEYNESEGEDEMVSSSEQSNLNDEFDTETAENDLAATIEEKKYVSIDDIEVSIQTVSLQFVFHDSTNWNPCEVVKVCENEAIDLAIISSATSSDDYISFDEIEFDDSVILPGQKVFMLSFPFGEEFALSNNKIMTQFYKGEVSRESDETKIQYSIPSTGGASGAPVFNECGKLIAINFAGMNQMENFNFGILSKYIDFDNATVESPAASSAN